MNPTPFPNLDLPLVDVTTGRINKGWYQLLASMYLLLGGTNPVSTPDLAVISSLMDENFAAAIEIEKGLDALATGNAANDSQARVTELANGLQDLLNAVSQQDALAAQVAELKNTLDALANEVPADSGIGRAELVKRLHDIETFLAFLNDGPFGTLATQNANNVNISGGTLSGITVDQSPWIVPTLINSWTNYNSTSGQPAGYYKDPNGIVHLRGFLRLATVNTTAFVLPAGYLPAYMQEFVCASNGVYGQVSVNPNGNVNIEVQGTYWIDLGSISYRADQ